MARPNKEGMTYFPHDVQARNDMKIRKLRAVHGNDGYATFFILLEMIYENKHYELDVSDAETRLILAEECRISSEKLDLIILKCTELGLFDKNIYAKRMILTGESIKKRTEPVENKRKRNKTYYEETKQNSQPEDKNQVSDAEMKVSEAETRAESTQSKDKVKKSKYKENKKDIIGEYTSNKDLIEAIKDFAEARKQLKKPLTDKALSLILKKLDSLASSDNEKIAILNQSVERGWQGVFELKEDSYKGKGDVSRNGQHKENTGSGIDDDIIARLSV